MLTPPNVFISFLGAIAYEKTQYFFQTDTPSSATSYVQQAIFELELNKIWTNNDKIFIFTTADAFCNNYENRITRFDFATQKVFFSDKKDGLKSVFEQLHQQGIVTHFEAIRIKNGNSVAEIWEVFQTIYQQLDALPEGTNVYFDITYGFRSLPIFGMVLLNYARTLKNIVVKHVFYGNFEVGREDKKQKINALIEQQADETTLAVAKQAPPLSPILDLSAFAELQEWTTAARAFLNGGNAELLSNVIRPTHPALGEQLEAFTDAILTCRGGDLVQRFDFQQFKTEVKNLAQESSLEVQLQPLLVKIEEKINPFDNQTTRNGFAAVEWCIQNGLIQQGYTFLEETCKSYVIEQTLGIEWLDNRNARDCARAALNQILSPKEDRTPQENSDYEARRQERRQMLPQMLVFVIHPQRGDFSKHYRSLTGKGGFRNDIAHCGYDENPKTPHELKQTLLQLYKNIRESLPQPVTYTID
jgi:CRISPR-associated Csx2 family protein